MSKKILILCFDTPFPTNYGGVYDIAAKFEYFKKNEIRIDLICTCFSSERALEFKKYLSENDTIIDNFYVELIQPNALSVFNFFRFRPFSAAIRKIQYNKIDFIKNQDYLFVLVEHLKSTYSIDKLLQQLKNEKKQPDLYLRVHNNEDEYYKNLYKISKSLKRYFFWSESVKYKYYQNRILSSDIFKGFLFISTNEMNQLSSIIKPDKIKMLLPVYSNTQLNQNINESKSIDFLYVGNLDLDDNLNALKKINSFLSAHDLHVFNIVIAGKCTGEGRRKKVMENFSAGSNVSFHFNLDGDLLKNLYRNAKYFLNFSSNSSGVKTKLIEAVSYGVPVISNISGVEGSNFENTVLMEDGLDVNWLKISLQDESIWKEYYFSYNQIIKEKIEYIETQYNEFLKSAKAIE